MVPTRRVERPFVEHLSVERPFVEQRIVEHLSVERLSVA